MPDSDKGEFVTRAALDRMEASIRREIGDLKELLSERDKANKEALGAALAAAERESAKTEQALKEYKVGSNEWRGTVTDLTSRMPTKEAVDQRFMAIEEKISDLRETRSKMGGKDEAIAQGKANQKWIIGLVVTLVLFIITQAIMVWMRQ